MVARARVWPAAVGAGHPHACCRAATTAWPSRCHASFRVPDEGLAGSKSDPMSLLAKRRNGSSEPSAVSECLERLRSSLGPKRSAGWPPPGTSPSPATPDARSASRRRGRSPPKNLDLGNSDTGGVSRSRMGLETGRAGQGWRDWTGRGTLWKHSVLCHGRSGTRGIRRRSVRSCGGGSGLRRTGGRRKRAWPGRWG